MSGQWENSNRRSQLPDNWNQLKAYIAERDNHRCQELMRDGTPCQDIGTECDHIEHGNNHSPDNLRMLCKWHHARKSSAEGNAARKTYTERRPKESHPGFTA